MDRGLTEFGRFAEPTLYILVSLSDGPKHGYAIMTDVEAVTGDPLGPGTLYGALARLERRGMIEALGPGARRRPSRHARALRGPAGRASVRAGLVARGGALDCRLGNRRQWAHRLRRRR